MRYFWLLLFCGTAHAQFVDDFNRSDEILDASSDWSDNAGSGTALAVDNNQVETNGIESARFVYTAPAQSSADFFVEADILFAPDTSTNNEALAIHVVDPSNYIYFRRNNTSSCLAGIREGASDTNWLADSPTDCDNATRMRIEAEGSTIRFYLDSGSGMTLYHTETSVTDFDTSVLGGFASTGATGTDGTALWDNFSMGDLDDAGDVSYYYRLRH